MRLNCMNCGSEYDGSITKDEIGWHSVCPECGSSFGVYVPEGRIVMAFSDDEVDNYKEYFTDGWRDENKILTYYAFDTPREFILAWLKMVEDPDGMWYWVLDDGVCICSGACDEIDMDIFEEHFGDALFAKYAISLEVQEVPRLTDDYFQAGETVRKEFVVNGLTLEDSVEGILKTLRTENWI